LLAMPVPGANDEVDVRTVVAGVPPAHNWFAADTAASTASTK
jgi:hypothetical protein